MAISLNPKEAFAFIAKQIIVATAVANGVPTATAEMAGGIAEGAVKGFEYHPGEKTIHGQLMKVIRGAIEKNIYSSKYEIPEECIDEIMTFFTSENALRYMEMSDPLSEMNSVIRLACSKSVYCDVETLPVNQISTDLLQKIYEEISNNHELSMLLTMLQTIEANRKLDTLIGAIKDISSMPVVLSVPENCHLKTGKELEFYEKWEESLFLEKKDGKKLGDVYVVPDYDFVNDEEAEDEEEHESLEKYMFGMINRQENINKSKKLSLILGGPGSGKSSLFSYFLNASSHVAKVETKKGNSVFVCGNRRVFLYCFRDLIKDKYADLDVDEILETMLSYMKKNAEITDLENTILLLDGFDECSISEIKRAKILKEMALQWGDISRIFVTCRHNYIADLEKLDWRISVISLKNFEKERIRDFIIKYKSFDIDKKEDKERIDSYLAVMAKTKDGDSVYGIPIILYMVMTMEEGGDLKSDISIEFIYERLFRENKIIDRLIKSEEGLSPKYNHDDDYASFKNYLKKISQHIAVYMFEHSDNHIADKKGLEEYIEKKDGLFSKTDGKTAKFDEVITKGMFMYIEGAVSGDKKIRYVHKSMYEYFMADYLYDMILSFYWNISAENGERIDRIEAQKILHKELSEILRKRRLSAEIIRYLQYKLSDENNKKMILEFSKFENFFKDMLNLGMTWHIEKDNHLDVSSEMSAYQVRSDLEKWDVQIFENMMYIVQAFRLAKGYIPEGVRKEDNTGVLLFGDGTGNDDVKERFSLYLKKKHYSGIRGSVYETQQNTKVFDLRGINLSRMDLSGTDLSRYDLSYSNAEETDFRNACLNECILKKTVLRNSWFQNAQFIQTVPSVESLFDGSELKIPWTNVIGYYNRSCEMKVPDDSYLFGKDPEHEPIRWKVLEVRRNRVLLLSEYILENKSFHNSLTEVDWEKSDVREWLNKSFYETAFTEEEKGKICETLIENHVNPQYPEECRKPSIDKVFLLSHEEIIQYFANLGVVKDQEDWLYNINNTQATGTEYAKHRKGSALLNNADGNCRWWLRTSGYGASRAMFIDHEGEINCYGAPVRQKTLGIRPAIWVKLVDE